MQWRRDLESRGQELRLRFIVIVRRRHRHRETVGPDRHSLGQTVLMHDSLTGIEEAERDRAGSRGAFDGPPRSAVLPLQLGSAKAIGIEQRDVAEIRYGDVDRLTREVGILDDARSVLVQSFSES